jgi:Adenylate and Guanylate cyclase catalytic domain
MKHSIPDSNHKCSNSGPQDVEMTSDTDGRFAEKHTYHRCKMEITPSHWIKVISDEREEKAYVRFLRKNFRYSLIHFGMLIPILAIVVFRFGLNDVENYSALKVTASIFIALSYIFSLVFLGIILSKAIRERLFDLSLPAARMIPHYIEDVVMASVQMAAAFNALYIICGGISPPKEQIILVYVTPVILPVVLGSPTPKGIIACWIYGFAFLCAIEIVLYSRFPYLAVCSEAFLLAALYEIEKNKLLIYESYRVEHHAAGVAKLNEVKERQLRRIERIDRKLNEALVQEMIPKKVAEKLRAGKKVMPEEFSDVTIFFSDVEGFMDICAKVRPIQVVNMLNELYTVMDYCTSLFPLYKVETIGDGYMVSERIISWNAMFKYLNIASFQFCTQARRRPARERPQARTSHRQLRAHRVRRCGRGEVAHRRVAAAHPHGPALGSGDGGRGGQPDASVLPVRRHGEHGEPHGV